MNEMIRDFSESAKQKLLAYVKDVTETTVWGKLGDIIGDIGCLLYTSPSPRDLSTSRMPSSA